MYWCKKTWYPNGLWTLTAEAVAIKNDCIPIFYRQNVITVQKAKKVSCVLQTNTYSNSAILQVNHVSVSLYLPVNSESALMKCTFPKTLNIFLLLLTTWLSDKKRKNILPKKKMKLSSHKTYRLSAVISLVDNQLWVMKSLVVSKHSLEINHI